MARMRRLHKDSGPQNVELTLVGSEQYSMVGYVGNPIHRYEQVLVVPDVATHLLAQTTRHPKTKQSVPVFVEGVVERPSRARRSETDVHRELRTKYRAKKNLNPNAALEGYKEGEAENKAKASA